MGGTLVQINMGRALIIAGTSGLRLAAEGSEVLKRFDAWKEEVGTTFYGRESGQALYLLADWTLWNCKVERTVLQPDHRIMLIAELVEIWVVCPNVLNELELADETCADHERRDAAIDAILRRAFRQSRTVCGSATDDFAPL
jgi:hypothetical protein